MFLTDGDEVVRRDDYAERQGVVLGDVAVVVDRNVDKDEDVIVFYLYTRGFLGVERRADEVLRRARDVFHLVELVRRRTDERDPRAGLDVLRLQLDELRFCRLDYLEH